ncbi:MAG TPA: metallophosphoesterase [Verrucomicrobiae bacterium]|jgi:hypothetical protein|nr:metallophosphoesterase [Verrucomicrobiae bacterium]
MSQTKNAQKKKGPEPLRFAHPYFTPAPPGRRNLPKVYGQRMTDHVQGTLHPIPPVRGDSTFTLADVIGQTGSDEVAAAGEIIIHIAGDTGVPEGEHETKQMMVADAMSKDYNANNPGKSPAFFFHVGDVIYGSAPNSYLDQFYRPYIHYPGKIVAIPGNHDGETSAKLSDFQTYFCADSQQVPPMAGSIFRQTVNQPGVYWCLDAPFVQIIGLYSNSAENPGFISGPKIGQDQKNWLAKTLKTLKAARDKGTRKALLFATHHPPYSSGGHSGSPEMLADIDDACQQAGIMPDAHFSGHAHSLQHYTRTVPFNGKTLKIPYVVSGCAGHGGQALKLPQKGVNANPVYEFGRKGWGYCKIVINKASLAISLYGVVDENTTDLVDGPTTVSLG